MKFKIFLIIAIVAYMAFFQDNGQDAVKAEMVAQSAARNNDQDKILVALQALKDPTVTQFVKDWSAYAPQPTPEQLSELRIIQQNINNDKSVAAKYNLKWHEEIGLFAHTETLFEKAESSPGL